MEFSPLGDSALLIRLPESTDLDLVLKLFERLRAAAIPGVTDVAPAYTTIGVFFAPARLIDAGAQPDKIFKFLEDKIREALANQSARVGTPSRREIEVPVCYDSEFAFDLHEVAQRTRRSPQEIVDLHTAAKYRVNCVGFTPRSAERIGHAASRDPAKRGPGRVRRNWRSADRHLSAAFTGRLEHHRADAASPFRSGPSPAGTSARGGSCPISRNQSRGV
jgi:hypothetical protein